MDERPASPFTLGVDLTAMLVAAGVLAAGCGGGCATANAPPAFDAAPWPEADLLFRSDPAWLGADAAYSVHLGGDRVLWLFGDTFVATSDRSLRSESRMVRNTVGVQVGLDPSAATVTFSWGTDDDGAPASFFPDDDDGAWYWPGPGARVGDALLLFWVRVEAAGEGAFGFQNTGSKAVLVENPLEDPSGWRMREVPLPENDLGVLLGFGGAVVADDHLYNFAPVEPGRHDIYLVRWRLSDVEAGDLSRPAWYTGTGLDAGFSEVERGQGARAVFPLSQTELSVHVDGATGHSIEVQVELFGATPIVMRTAPALEGPWSLPVVVYRPPEMARENILIYSAKAHPWAEAGGDLVVTYNTNHTDFGTLVNDSALYYPRFVRLARRR